MTKKHFQAIARIFHKHNVHDGNRGQAELAREVAAYFATVNPNFDRTRFLAACRGERVKGMCEGKCEVE